MDDQSQVISIKHNSVAVRLERSRAEYCQGEQQLRDCDESYGVRLMPRISSKESRKTECEGL